MQKVIVITGASGGLGECMAKYFSSKGYIVYGTSRSIIEGTRNYISIKMDITDKNSVNQAVNTIIEQHNKIDVLINNAGLGIAGPLEYLELNDVENVLNTNVTGVMRVCQAVLPIMRANRKGLIINISSIGSETGLPYRGLYSASKAAVDRLTEAMRVELAPYGIQACYLQPGGIQTNINKNRIKTSLPADAVYKKSFEKTYDLIDESVNKGLNPDVFGPIIEKIIHSKNVK